MTQPTCAFIMTTKNGYSKGLEKGKWLKESLDSLFAQDYTGKFIVVVNDDHSDQDTRDFLVAYCHAKNHALRSENSGFGDSMFINLDNSDDCGISHGFNVAARMAIREGAKWLFLQADDDISRPNRLSDTMKYLDVWKSLGHDPKLLSAWIEDMDNEGNILFEAGGRETRPDRMRIMMTRNISLEAGAILAAFRCDAWEELGGYDEDLKWAADLDIIYRAIVKKFVQAGIPRILYSYRMADRSGTGMGNTWNVTSVHAEAHAEEMDLITWRFRKATNPFFRDQYKVGLKFAKIEKQERTRLEIERQKNDRELTAAS